MNSMQMIWHNLKRRLIRPRLTLDAPSLESLRRLASRQHRTPQEVARSLFEQAAREEENRSGLHRCWEDLTPRQQQITAHICRGSTGRQIAAALCISPTTVKSHAEAILHKFGLPNRAALRKALSAWDLTPYL
jgi:DNA-binding NarL/FixJ family response regulator